MYIIQCTCKQSTRCPNYVLHDCVCSGLRHTYHNIDLLVYFRFRCAGNLHSTCKYRQVVLTMNSRPRHNIDLLMQDSQYLSGVAVQDIFIVLANNRQVVPTMYDIYLLM